MWVKICGIRDEQTAAAVAALGPDAIGLNFYSQSPRVVTADVAERIVRELPSGVEPTGVFVNHPVDEILDICERCNLHIVQLHGDETPQRLADLQQRNPALRIIRAHRLGVKGTGELAAYISECRHLDVKLLACLVDAHADGVYGGSGKSVPWDAIAPNRRDAHWPQLILAGGLKPQNVTAAIAAVQPWGVDVASGVESSPGVKDLAAVEEFIQFARVNN